MLPFSLYSYIFMIILMETWNRENKVLSFNNAYNFLSGFYTTDKQWSKEKH